MQLYLTFYELIFPRSSRIRILAIGKSRSSVSCASKRNSLPEAVASLRFVDALRAEMAWIYASVGEAVYQDLTPFKDKILAHFEKQELKITPANRKKLLNSDFWTERRQVMAIAAQLQADFGDQEYDDFNRFTQAVDLALEQRNLKLAAADRKAILMAVSWKDDTAQPVIKKQEKNGAIVYEADPDLRDSENVPLSGNIQTYFAREVVPYVPDAWIDPEKTVKGYSISFTRYFYSYTPPRDVEAIKQEILQLEKETEGILEELVRD